MPSSPCGGGFRPHSLSVVSDQQFQEQLLLVPRNFHECGRARERGTIQTFGPLVGPDPQVQGPGVRVRGARTSSAVAIIHHTVHVGYNMSGPNQMMWMTMPNVY
jgi:hypothetical protein